MVSVKEQQPHCPEEGSGAWIKSVSVLRHQISEVGSRGRHVSAKPAAFPAFRVGSRQETRTWQGGCSPAGGCTKHSSSQAELHPHRAVKANRQLTLTAA